METAHATREEPTNDTSRRDTPALDPKVTRIADSRLREFIVTGFGGRKVFRILLSDACRYACDACPMGHQRRLSRDLHSAARLAALFLTAYRRGWCDGLFVTAGVPRNPVWAMERLLELVEIVRFRFGFRGYLHAKAMPGAEPGQVERLMRVVDRVSFRYEPPCEAAASGGSAASPPAPRPSPAGRTPASLLGRGSRTPVSAKTLSAGLSRSDRAFRAQRELFDPSRFAFLRVPAGLPAFARGDAPRA